jgi:N-dimethylarginine dimethylaminohydrolase
MSLRDSPQYYHVVLERIPPRATPAFEEEDMQKRVWGRRWGVWNDVGALRMALLHRPGDEIKLMTADKYDPAIEALIDDREQWYFRSDAAPDLERMQREHDGLATALREQGVEVEFVDCSPRNPNAMFLRDDAIIVKGGAVISRMGPVGEPYGTGRRGEEAYVSRKIASLGMPILRTIHGTGLLEGGSFCFLDERHAAVGASYRGNREGIDQLRNVLQHQDIELIEVPLVGFSLHLDGAIVMVSHKTALVDITRLPFWFLDVLKDLDIRTVYLDARDDHIAINCLALSPRKVLMNDRGKYTAEALDRLGLEVIQIPYDECHKHGGSIHCSTLPLIRDPD